MLVVAVDPGARHTGIVSVDVTNRQLLDYATVVKAGDLLGHEPAYYAEILQLIDDFRDLLSLTVAVEGINAPGGFADGRKQLLDPTGIIGSAIVLGVVLGAYPDAVVVPPGKRGQAPQQFYPDEIRGTERGRDKKRHMRSAYDVALGVPQQVRIQQAIARQQRPLPPGGDQR